MLQQSKEEKYVGRTPLEILLPLAIEIYGRLHHQYDGLLCQATRDIHARMFRSVKQSLSRLQLEKVELFQIHGPALSVRSIKHLANGLADAHDAGLCKAVGVSKFSADQVRLAHSTLLKRNILLESLNRSFELLGKYSAAKPPPSGRKFENFTMEEIEPLLTKLKEIGGAHGKTQSQVSLNWIISKGAIPIPGAKNAKQGMPSHVRVAEDNAGVFGWKLTSEEVSQISQLGKLGKNTRV